MNAFSATAANVLGTLALGSSFATGSIGSTVGGASPLQAAAIITNPGSYSLSTESTVNNVTNTVNPTITTNAAHGLAVGQSVTITGVVGATGVDGVSWSTSVPSTTTFTIALAVAPGAYTSGGTVTLAPTVTVSGGGFNGFAGNTYAIATATGIVTGFAAGFSPGSGYTSAPAVTFTGGGASIGATGVATINGSGQVTGVLITNPGSGYTSAAGRQLHRRRRRVAGAPRPAGRHRRLQCRQSDHHYRQPPRPVAADEGLISRG